MTRAFRKLFSTTKTPSKSSSQSICGVAASDSKDGNAKIKVSGNTLEVPTEVAVEEGQRVSIEVINHSMVVKGVIGGGDVTRDCIETIKSDQDYIAIMTDVDIWDEPAENVSYSKQAVIAKMYYESGKWSIERINALLEAGKITEQEYVWIVGENK